MADIAIGGQGAPLTPLYHQYLLENKDGIIINLGGIANITIVQNNQLIGFDSGPANILLDNWIRKYQNLPYDKNGIWAKSGQIIQTLLTELLADDYFQKTPPKSTGFEYFNLNWLKYHLTGDENPADIQATLLALTTHSIIQSLSFLPSPARSNEPGLVELVETMETLPIYLCGGGVHNTALVTQLKTLCQNPIYTTDMLGIDPDYLEAVAFSYFAQQTLEKKPSNHPAITGAKEQRILGGVYYTIK